MNNIVTELMSKIEDRAYSHYLTIAEKALKKGNKEEAYTNVRFALDIAWTHGDERCTMIIKEYIKKMKG